MKDSSTFDWDREGLDRAFLDQREAYQRIFSRCGIEFSIVEASSGAMGGSESSEFVARTDAGEDLIASCSNCGYAANVEKATSRLPDLPLDELAGDELGPASPEEFPTPGVRTIDDLARTPYLVSADRQIKTLVYMVNRMQSKDDHLEALIGEPLLVLLRGDHQL